MNSQHTQSALTSQKISAAHFKDVKTEEAFINQDQKVVETTNLWRQLSWDKNRHSTNPLLQRSRTQWNWWLEQQWTHQDFLTSHTLSWKMKKFVPQKIASRTNTKKDIFQKHKDQNLRLSNPKNCQQTHNVLTTKKTVAVYFKDVKTEGTFSSQDQKLVETTNLWRQLSWDKNRHSTNPLLQRSLTQWNWWLEQQWTHQDFLTSHTLSWKMKKFVPQKIASRTNTKKDIFQKQKDQNQRLSTPKNCQQTHNVLTTKKTVAVYFKDVKTEGTFSSRDQKLVETTNLWRQLSWDKNRHSSNPLLQRSLTQWDWWLEQQLTHQDFLTSHTLSWKMKKFVPQKIVSRTNTKKEVFQKHKHQNPEIPWTVNIPKAH